MVLVTIGVIFFFSHCNLINQGKVACLHVILKEEHEEFIKLIINGK